MHIEFDMQVKRVDRQLNVEDCSWEGGYLGWRLYTVLPVFFCTLLLPFYAYKSYLCCYLCHSLFILLYRIPLYEYTPNYLSILL